MRERERTREIFSQPYTLSSDRSRNFHKRPDDPFVSSVRAIVCALILSVYISWAVAGDVDGWWWPRANHIYGVHINIILLLLLLFGKGRWQYLSVEYNRVYIIFAR